MSDEMFGVLVGGGIATVAGVLTAFFAAHLEASREQRSYRRQRLERLIELCAIIAIDLPDSTVDFDAPNVERIKRSLSIMSELELIVEIYLPLGKAETVRMATAHATLQNHVLPVQTALSSKDQEGFSKGLIALREVLRPATSELSKASMDLRTRAIEALRAA